MPEQNPHPTSQKTHEHIYAAMEFAEQAHTLEPHNSIDRPRISKEGDMGVIRSAFVSDGGTQATSIRYRDNYSERHATKPTSADIEPTAETSAGQYEAQFMICDGELYSPYTSAAVSREGYGTHVFKDDSKEKAALLIGNLAAKQIGTKAMKKFDEIVAAKEAFVKKSPR